MIGRRGFELLKTGVRSSGFKTFAVFAGSNFIVSIIHGLGGLLQARWVSPEVFGEFQKYGILTTYLGICILVVNDGLIRQYPYYIGKGRQDRAMEIAGVAKWWFLFVTWIVGAVFAVLSVLAVLRGDWRAACGWGAQIVLSVAASYGIYLGILYRTSTDFRRLASNNLIGSITAFCSLVFVRFWGYFGVALRAVLTATVNLVVNRYYLPVKVKAVFNLKQLFELSMISLKFSLPSYFHSYFLLASRRTLILFYCFQSGLGLYSFAAALYTLAKGFSTALAQIMNVKLNTRFGETEDIWASFRSALRPTAFGLALSVFLVAICWFTVPWFVRIWIPKYVDAIPCFRMLLFALVTGALSLPLLVFKAALMWKTAAAQAFSNFGVTVLLIWILPKTLVMVALATVLGGFSESVVGYGALYLLYRQRHGSRGGRQ